MLTTTYQVDPAIVDPDLSGYVFLPPSGTGGDVQYAQGNNILIDESAPQTITIPSGFNISANSITIKSAAATAITLNVSADITAQSVSFDSHGPYTLNFAGPGSNTISGGIVSIQSTLTVNVPQFVTATIDSGIVGSSNELFTQGLGTLTLTGSVTVAAIQAKRGTLALNGATTITNNDSSGNGLWIQNDATITGTGPLALENSSPFNYASTVAPPSGSTTSPSSYSGPISGSGQVQVRSGQLDIASAANSYSGGTDIVAGTLQLEKDAALNAPATLGTGDLFMGTGVLDLNGCSITLPGLKDDATASGTNGGRITDTTFNASGPPVSVITLDNATSNPCTFSGAIEKTGLSNSNHATIRFVKEGPGTLVLNGGDGALPWPVQTEIDEGCVQFGSIGGGSSEMSLTMNGGTLDMNGRGVEVNQLDGNGGVITDGSHSASYENNPREILFYGTLDGAGPSVFGGRIVEKHDYQSPQLYLEILTGWLTLTGANDFSAGTYVAGRLNVVRSAAGTGGLSLRGNVAVGSQDALTFDIASGGPAATFSGDILAFADEGTQGQTLIINFRMGDRNGAAASMCD